MQGAKVAVFEDNQDFHRIIETYLEIHGHTITALETSREGALRALDSMSAGDLEADVVLLDGTLEHETPGLQGEDAAAIIARIKELGISSWVVGISSFELRVFGIEVDVDLTKQDIASVGHVIDQL